MDAEPFDLHLQLKVVIVDPELLAAVSPPAVQTESGGLTAPNDDMRVASVLGSLLLGLKDGIQAQAGIRILEMEAVGIGRPAKPAAESAAEPT